MPKKHLILLVEDDLPIVNIIHQRFEQENFDLLVAKDGEQGLKMALESHPEAILLDIIMPKMNGLEMLKKLRADAWGASAKVLILTNLSNAQSEQEAADYHVADYIIKTDWKLGELVDKIKKVLP